MQRRHFRHWLAGSTLAAATPLLRAQAWPDKPVRWVLSQPPGSGPDNVARILSDRLAKAWGQAVVIENRPGGQNTVGAQAAARPIAEAKGGRLSHQPRAEGGSIFRFTLRALDASFEPVFDEPEPAS